MQPGPSGGTERDGFLRASNGTISAFYPPGSVLTQANGINPQGAITGYYIERKLGYAWLLRAQDGTFVTLDPPLRVTWPGSACDWRRVPTTRSCSWHPIMRWECHCQPSLISNPRWNRV
ncbi:MAG TPA: hypothetical protein VGY99_11775 [Candidatus Binataceae bacterium]|nr:hypothetical protein [Candidatus Binataceae bacterium]